MSIELARVFLAGTLFLAACRSSGTSEVPPSDPGSPPTARASEDAGSSHDPAVTPELALTGDAAALDEPKLSWGTRPARTGAFFPVVDGMCIHAEVWPLENGVLLTYGNSYGAYTRGSTPTMALFGEGGIVVGDAVTKGLEGTYWERAQPAEILGRWPDQVVLLDDASGRSSSYANVWAKDSAGWKRVLRSTADDVAGGSNYRWPLLRGGSLLVVETAGVEGGDLTSSIRGLGLSPTAPPPLPKLLRAGLEPALFLAWKDELFFFGAVYNDWQNIVVRRTASGSVKEEPMPGVDRGHVRAVAANAFLLVHDQTNARRFDGTQWSADAIEAKVKARRTRIVAASASATDEVWFGFADGTIWQEKADKSIVERSPPEPLSDGTAYQRRTQHTPARGSVLAGIEVGDPWAVGRSGALFHLVGEAWQKVELPKPQFATATAYLAESVVRTKDEVYVNAGYGEKGVGWRSPERYRAILRTQRPREVMRCNEPDLSASYSSGKGFQSWPPLADDTCATPFVVVFHGGSQTIGNDYPIVRETLRGRTDLGDTVALVDFKGGDDRRHMGAKVPSVAAGRAFSEALAKKMAFRPEVVCGDPVAERTLMVEVSTGKVVK